MLGHSLADLESGTRERHAPAQRQGELERKRLGSCARHDAVVHRDIEHRPGDRQHLKPELIDLATNDRIGRRKHMGADRQREVAAPLGPDTTTDAL